MRPSAILTLLAALLLNGGGADNANAAADKQEQIASGQVLFMDLCAKCHPRTERGDYLQRIPATVLTRRSEAELMAWIAGRDKHRLMPTFVNLTEQEKHDLAIYLLNQLPDN